MKNGNVYRIFGIDTAMQQAMDSMKEQPNG